MLICPFASSQVFKKYKLHHKAERVFCVSEIKLNCFQPATILVAMAADGTVLPPFVVFPGVRLKLSSVRDAFPGAAFTSTYDGQINEDVFLWWFRDHFLKHVPSVGRKPSALFLSRWVVDVTLQLAQKAKEEKVHHVYKIYMNRHSRTWQMSTECNRKKVWPSLGFEMKV